jgi:hypothetical protein
MKDKDSANIFENYIAASKGMVSIQPHDEEVVNEIEVPTAGDTGNMAGGQPANTTLDSADASRGRQFLIEGLERLSGLMKRRADIIPLVVDVAIKHGFATAGQGNPRNIVSFLDGLKENLATGTELGDAADQGMTNPAKEPEAEVQEPEMAAPAPEPVASPVATPPTAQRQGLPPVPAPPVPGA